jgi:Tfp pilus assembly protein PilN
MKRINLLPPEFGQRRRARRVTSAFGLAGVVYVVLLGVLWMLGNGRLDGARRDFQEATGRVDAVQARVAKLSQFSALQADVDRKERTLATVMADDVHWSRVLTDLSMVIPADAWLTSMSATATPASEAAATKGAAPAAPTAAPKLGTITFAAVTSDFPGVATWISRMSSDRILQTIWVPSATKGEIGDHGVVNFNSTGELSEDAASRRYQGEPAP